MRTPIQAAPVVRPFYQDSWALSARASSGVRPSDSLEHQCCGGRSLSGHYCFWGLDHKGCDAANNPYVVCKA